MNTILITETYSCGITCIDFSQGFGPWLLMFGWGLTGIVLSLCLMVLGTIWSQFYLRGGRR